MILKGNRSARSFLAVPAGAGRCKAAHTNSRRAATAVRKSRFGGVGGAGDAAPQLLSYSLLEGLGVATFVVPAQR